jgi:hypothetical protein
MGTGFAIQQFAARGGPRASVSLWEWTGGLLESMGQHTICQVSQQRIEFRILLALPQTSPSVREPTS